MTVKHIMENFHKLGKPAERSTYMRGSNSTQMQSDESDSDSARTSVRSGSYRYGSVDDANWVVGVDKIHHLISMCGGDLDKFESFYLLRRSTNYGSTKASSCEVSLNDFTEAVESYMNDANMDAYALVLYLFKLKFGEQENLVYL